MLSIHKINKQFSSVPVIQNVTIDIKKGSIIGLAGPSGSGKSTLLRCIQKLEKIDSGDITYFGTSCFMFQDFQLFPHMTVLENISYAPQCVFKKADYKNEALHLLSQLGLEQKAHTYPCNLSGGQKQRIALARCLMMKPDILLCDEPTSGLDVATIEDVVQLLKKIHSMGVTMLIASHDLTFLTHIADRIIVLNKGIKTADINISQLENPIEHLKEFYQENVS